MVNRKLFDSNARRGSLFWLPESANTEPVGMDASAPLPSPCLHLPLISSSAWSTRNLWSHNEKVKDKTKRKDMTPITLKNVKLSDWIMRGSSFSSLEAFFNSTGGYSLWWLVKKEREREKERKVEVEVTQNFPCVNFN